ncbi:MAG TPA: hypothetical protein VGV64_03310 [Thermoplasmata archaeon]|nr:hypothetical protein [Thermoplasmata archaeon]
MSVQRLFGNDYTPRAPVERRRTPLENPRFRALHRTPVVVGLRRTAWVGALALLLLSGPAAAAPSSYVAGRVSVAFPSLTPGVDLRDTSNLSVGSNLTVDQVLEVHPSASMPTVVAVAFPSNLTVSNATVPGGGSTVTMRADLTVYPSEAAPWAGPEGLVSPDGAPLGFAHLLVRYVVAPSGARPSGVTANWTVSSWPVRSPSDAVGLQLGVATIEGTGFVACTSVPLAGSPACDGTALPSGATIWGAAVTGLEGEAGGGLLAAVGWEARVASGPTAGDAVLAGIYAESPTEGHLVLAVPSGGAPTISSDLTFGLVPPPIPLPVPTVLRATPTAFLGALAAFGALGLVGTAWYRRRARAIEAEL